MPSERQFLNEPVSAWVFVSFSSSPGEVLALASDVLILLFASVASPWKLAPVPTAVPQLEGVSIHYCKAFKSSGTL